MSTLIEVRSAVDDDTNQPKLGNCTLSLGDGTEKVHFENGRAMVERHVIDQYLINNQAIEIPELGVWRQRGGSGSGISTAATPDNGALEKEGVDSIEGLTAEEKADLVASLLEDKDVAGALKAKLTDDGQPDDDDPGTKAAADAPETAAERKLRESAEHLEQLKAEGELEDDVEPKEPAPAAVRVVPSGFDDKTAENELRCLAKKGDQKQCANAAKDSGPACHLAAHQAQFAS